MQSLAVARTVVTDFLESPDSRSLTDLFAELNTTPGAADAAFQHLGRLAIDAATAAAFVSTAADGIAEATAYAQTVRRGLASKLGIRL